MFMECLLRSSSTPCCEEREGGGPYHYYFFTFEVWGVKPITTAGAAENQRKQAVFIRKNNLLNGRISFIANSRL
jgi:hypothetical protein